MGVHIIATCNFNEEPQHIERVFQSTAKEKQCLDMTIYKHFRQTTSILTRLVVMPLSRIDDSDILGRKVTPPKKLVTGTQSGSTGSDYYDSVVSCKRRGL